MKILFTGMLSSHCKKPSDVSNKTFFVALSEVMSNLHPEAEIEWKAPSLDWDTNYLSQYDFIFVGFVPPTALSANMVYGTLKMLDTIYDWSSLRLVLDSGQLWQYGPSFSAISKDPTYLVSNFYSKRPGHKQVNNYKTLASFKSVADKFLALPWPTTIYPELPWASEKDLSKHLPKASKTLGVGLDNYYLQGGQVYKNDRTDTWAVENHKSTWAQKLRKTVLNPFNEIKLNKKFNDSDAQAVIDSSMGLVIPPVERGVGTWWTYRYIQGLLSGTPIITDWTESAKIGLSWGALAYQVEDMSPEERKQLSARQYVSYINELPDLSELKQKFLVVLENKGEVYA